MKRLMSIINNILWRFAKYLFRKEQHYRRNLKVLFEDWKDIREYVWEKMKESVFLFHDIFLSKHEIRLEMILEDM